MLKGATACKFSGGCEGAAERSAGGGRQGAHSTMRSNTFSTTACLLLHCVLGAAALVAQGGSMQPALRRGPALRALLASVRGCSGEADCSQLPFSALASPVGDLGDAAGLAGELTLRLRGGKKGTASQGKRGTGAKSHPGYKYNLSAPRISRHQTSKRKRYCLKKKPEREGRCKHLREVNRRFKHGFRCNAPWAGPKATPEA